MKGLKSMTYYLIDYENTGENGLRGITELHEDACIVIFYSENADKISFDMHQKLIECKAAIEYRKISTGKRNALDFQLSTYLGYLIARCENDAFYIVSKDNGYRVVVDFWKERDVQQIDRIILGISRPERKDTELAAGRNRQEASAPVVSASEKEGAVPAVSVSEKEAPVSAVSASEKEGPVPAVSASEKKVPVPAISPSEKEVPVPAVSPLGKEVPVPVDSASEKEVTVPAVSVSEKEVHQRTEGGEAAGTQNTPARMPLSEKELREQVAQVIIGEEEQENICRFITKYKTKQGVNNAIMKLYGSEKAGELYKKIKPLIKDKKGK